MYNLIFKFSQTFHSNDVSAELGRLKAHFARMNPSALESATADTKTRISNTEIVDISRGVRLKF